ncbi:MAG: DUF1080 domain-containing protein [Pirellulales bacterium]
MFTRSRAVALFVLVGLCAPVIAHADETVELFNGKDFTGWTKRGGKATYKIENGEIIGQSAPNTTNTFLCTEKDYRDFELEYDFKISDQDFNSGVQIRSHARPEKDEERVYGYQIEIDPKPRAFTGGIYFEGGSKDQDGKWIRKGMWLQDLSQNAAARKAFRLGEWNHIRVVATGRRLQTWVNGVPAADYTDDDDKAFTPAGFIALQVHAVGGSKDTKEVRWKNIKLKELK